MRKQNYPRYDVDEHASLLLLPNGQLPSSSKSFTLPNHVSLPTVPFDLNVQEYSTLYYLLKSIPQGETDLNIIHSILPQAINSISFSSNQNI